MHHFTCWTLIISRINRAWLYKGLNDSHRQPNSDLAQFAEHETDEVVSSNPNGGNFWRNLFCSVEICQIIWQKWVSWKIQLCFAFWNSIEMYWRIDNAKIRNRIIALHVSYDLSLTLFFHKFIALFTNLNRFTFKLNHKNRFGVTQWC